MAPLAIEADEDGAREDRRSSSSSSSSSKHSKVTAAALKEVHRKSLTGLRGCVKDYLNGGAGKTGAADQSDSNDSGDDNDGGDDTNNGQAENEAKFSPQKDGLDVFHVKNSVMATYLIDLVLHIKSRNAAKQVASGSHSDSDEEDPKSHNLHRLNETKIVLEKMRGLQKKMQYQIDKLQTAASSSGLASQQFASSGDNQDVGDDDPLNYRPSLMDDDSSDDDDNSNDDDVNDDDDDDIDDDDDDDDEEEEDADLAHAKATLGLTDGIDASSKKKARSTKKSRNKEARNNNHNEDDDDGGGDDEKNDGNETINQSRTKTQSNKPSQIYQAPRSTSVPYVLDAESKKKTRLEQEKRHNRRMRNSEFAQHLQQEYGDAPEQEDALGGTDFGRQQHAAREYARRQAEKVEYEESAMVRLTTTRKEKKEFKRLMRGEQSNLTAIANLNNLTKGMEGVYDRRGGGGSDDDDDAEFDMRNAQIGVKGQKEEKRYSNGKRRRDRDSMGDGRSRSDAGGKGKKKKGFKAKNSLQAELFR